MPPQPTERLPEDPSAKFHQGTTEVFRVNDPVEQLLEEMSEEAQPKSLGYGSSLRGRVAVVTGGATGIGRAIALEFARHGASVAFNYFVHDGAEDVREEAEATAREIQQMEVRVHHCACDVRESGEVNRFVRDVQEELGAINIL
ncbi:MAG: SDR family NAD(P)-dependent oxidoreductase, partial [Gemmatimonadetes bacterium]|nr:SDR family NAD(P)-dependent oxidoreductase [Gemmatimonadota bacterium]